MSNEYKKPTGTAHGIYKDMLRQEHLLIAGCKGSGKSTVMNGMLYAALEQAPTDESDGARFILIDPKGIDFLIYADIPHTLAYASEEEEIVAALEQAVSIMEARYKEVAARSRTEHKRYSKYWGGHVYVIVDEYADLITTIKRETQPLIQRLAQKGRAANVHVILATQCPKADVIDTKIKCNFDSRVGLRTSSRQDSRNILDRTNEDGGDACAALPKYGYGIYSTADGVRKATLPMYQDAELEARVAWWVNQREQERA